MVLSSLSSDLRADLDDLSLLLSDDDWRGADRLTADLMLRAIAHTPYSEAASPRRPHSWLSAEALATVPCQLLHAIDDRWWVASDGQFGFSAQLQVYREILAAEDFDPSLYNWSNPHPFFEQVGWLMLFPLRPIGFLKFYPQLEFGLDAPMGHLPALWYWRVPRLASLVAGGFFTGQGGGFGDLARLDAMLLRLTRCHQSGG